jgi:hypothetical protein
MSLTDLLLGRPLATEEEKAERIAPGKGIPIFGLDALSSAAYGPEAALTLLIPLGMAGVAYIVPISVSIIILLAIVYFSYRQTIMAYPQGGGSYTVASENLGMWPGLLAAASLMVDYVLTAAVGISAGVGALISAVPWLEPHTLALCLAILLVVTLVNLRGVSATGGIFLAPTYLFIFCLLGMIALGVFKTLAAGGHPVPVVAPPHLTAATEAVGIWLLLRAFASGCTAMTGVEAVSNGVMAFKEPACVTARFTLTLVIGILMTMLHWHRIPCQGIWHRGHAPGRSGLSECALAVARRHHRQWRLLWREHWIDSGGAGALRQHGLRRFSAPFPGHRGKWLPAAWAGHPRTPAGLHTGRLCAGPVGRRLLTVFGGVTDRLIPLYAVGAFMAFTLSQAGMVVHWKRVRGAGSSVSMFVNGLGAPQRGSR